ncbi:MAG: hypothetical protein D6681_11390 [Calditrichaeota bacterium]|nr:MAG: hypothetical protein D6681_11390 [Calditrichota bacterium]
MSPSTGKTGIVNMLGNLKGEPDSGKATKKQAGTVETPSGYLPAGMAISTTGALYAVVSLPQGFRE